MRTRHQLRHPGTTIGVAALIGALAALTGCGSSATTGATTSLPPATTAVTTPEVPLGGFDVRSRTETLVDASRPTPAIEGTGVPADDQRTLATTFTFPDAPGPFPLVVYAHGHNGHPRKAQALIDAWAAAGFVVAAPAFPLSNDEVPGAPSVFDLTNQSGDVGFVIDTALARSEEGAGFLAGRIDPDRIGVAGLSLGGATVYQAAFADCCRDDRIDAVIAMDALTPADLDLSSGLPLLVIHADEDPVTPYAAAQQAFAAAAPPKYLITLHEAVHSSPYEELPDPADGLVRDSTTAFWRLYLAGDDASARELQADAGVPGLTTVVARPG